MRKAARRAPAEYEADGKPIFRMRSRAGGEIAVGM
jgi:hypothetical protein